MSAGKDVEPAGGGGGAAELTPGTLVGGYEVEGVLGTGGMGVVYGARQPRINKRVAIKVLAPAFCGDPSTVARFEQEARLVNEIGHPSIVDVFQFGELPDGRSFFVMEFLDGESLGTRIDRGQISARETIDIVDKICDALVAAHEKGVIHRDLKADNVFLSKKGVKLLDFGLAKLAGRGDPSNIHTTKSGILVGTPAYMSPEQARGKEVDPRTDIYALGVLSYKMLTGRLPFNADNAMDLIVQQLHRPPPAPDKLVPKTPSKLSKLVVQMMSKAPEERPSLEKVRAVLAEVRGDAPATTEAASERPDQDEKRGGLGLLAAAATVLVVVIGVFAFVLLSKDKPDEPATGSDPATPVTAPAPPPAPPPSPDPGIEMDPKPAPIPTAQTPAQKPPGPATPAAAATGSAIHDKAGSATPSTGPVTRPDGDAPTPTPPTPAPTPPAPKPGAILVQLDLPSKITIDGKVVADGSKGGRFDVPAGHHTLEAVAADHSPITRSLDVEPDGTALVSVSFGN